MRRINKIRLKRKFRRHTKQRLFERYGFESNRDDLKQMKNLIKNNESKPLRKLSNMVSEHLIKYKGLSIRVLYSKKHKEITTALPGE